jgi:hypothetical protein
VNRASDNLESALKNLDTVTGRMERGEGTLGRLTKDEKLINEVEGVVESVGEFVGGVSRLQTIVVLRTDYQFLAAGVKSYVELRVQPREDKYYLIEVINDPKGLTRYQQVYTTTDNPNEPPQSREVRTITTNSLRFSLQFAQSFGPFTGRFGIKESTGGVGLDLLLFQDRFELKQDLFGFGEIVLPRWRVSLGYEFVNRLWLIGGVDDILSEGRRDYFVGAQLKFNDEDLKTILAQPSSSAVARAAAASRSPTAGVSAVLSVSTASTRSTLSSSATRRATRWSDAGARPSSLLSCVASKRLPGTTRAPSAGSALRGWPSCLRMMPAIIAFERSRSSGKSTRAGWVPR